MRKILLLGSSGSGKTTIFKQMRLVHYGPFTRQETESYRQLIYLNITDGLHAGISRMNTSGFSVTEENRELLRTVAEHGHDLKDDEPFLTEYRHPIEWLWKDPNVQAMYANGNQAGLPEKYVLSRPLCRDSADLDGTSKPIVLLSESGPSIQSALRP